MRNTVATIAKREYLKIVRKRSFWAAVLLLPAAYLVLILVVGSSADSVEKKITEQLSAASKVLVVDQTGLVADAVLVPPLERAADYPVALEQVQHGDADAVLYYPADLAEAHTITVDAKETSLVGRGRFNSLAQNVLKQSMLLDIGDTGKITLFNAPLTVSSHVYQDGVELQQGIESFLVPIIAVAIFFLLVMFSASYMLMSVAEEKENRMIETILSIVPSRTLIWGKIFGLTGITFTQFIAQVGFAVLVTIAASRVTTVPIDWSAVHVSALQVLSAGFFILAGFFFIACAMVGVGAAMPTYRDAQQFSGIFILLSIFPIYFATILIADPAGTLARTLSFLPFTGPLILLFRSSLGTIGGMELVLGVVATLAYVVGAFYLAFKLFDLGSMEFTNKLSLRRLLR